MLEVHPLEEPLVPADGWCSQLEVCRQCPVRFLLADAGEGTQSNSDIPAALPQRFEGWLRVLLTTWKGKQELASYINIASPPHQEHCHVLVPDKWIEGIFQTSVDSGQET